MSRLPWIVSVSLLSLILTSCDRKPQAKAPSVQPSPQTFSQPMVAPSTKPLPSVKIPGMIQTSDRKTPPLAVATSSTRDPFAAAAVPTQLQTRMQPVQNPVQQPAPQEIVTQPIVDLAPSPTPAVALKAPLLPQSQPISALPSLPVGTLPGAPPPISRTNLAEAIDVTGVVEIGGKLTAIVQEPNSGSRYVKVGDRLSNGQVIVKRINMSVGGEPSIVLQQNGVEFTKGVGSSNVARSL
jgi:hypothetical protein